MALVAIGPPKLCPKCGFKRPRSDFYAKRCKGGVYAYPLCKEHEKERVMKRQRANRERTRAADTRARRRKLSDPERAAIHRDYQRQWYRSKHGLTPDQYRPTHMKKTPSIGQAKRLPIEPFAQWLETLGDSSTEIAMVTGLPDRQVRTYLARKRRILSDVADGVLLHVGNGVKFEDLWGTLSVG